jgi:hypothetical protein
VDVSKWGGKQLETARRARRVVLVLVSASRLSRGLSTLHHWLFRRVAGGWWSVVARHARRQRAI